MLDRDVRLRLVLAQHGYELLGRDCRCRTIASSVVIPGQFARVITGFTGT